jgi:hypothetical protein
MARQRGIESVNREEVAVRLGAAIHQLKEVDGALLMLDANERSITHRLAVHVGKVFDGWDVDCEYNRNRHDQKVLQLPRMRVANDDTDARTVFPDIIVHRRNTSENLLVIEARKRASQTRGIDQRVKLRAYVVQLGYRHAAYVLFDPSPDVAFEFVE